MLQVKRFVSDERGATALEYGLLAALIAAFIIASVENLQQSTISTFNYIVNAMASVTGGGGGS